MNGNIEAQKMHQNFFDRCAKAIKNEFYMEAILMEYLPKKCSKQRKVWQKNKN